MLTETLSDISLLIEESHLAEGWFVVQSRAAVSMSASSNFKIEGTVNPGKKELSSAQCSAVTFLRG